jgi:hypothetical protein
MSNQSGNLVSIGHLCQTYQRPFPAVQRALEEIGARPRLTLNGLPYYGEADAERAGERLQAGRVGRARP